MQTNFSKKEQKIVDHLLALYEGKEVKGKPTKQDFTLHNRYGYPITKTWLSDDKVIINVPKSMFTRNSQTNIGELSMVDWEGGPYIELGTKIFFEDKGLFVKVTAINFMKGEGYVLTLQETTE
jgi:hypothetical protein